MSVLGIEEYRQKNGDDILRVILKSTKNFPERYFYCDSYDEELVKKFTWCLMSQKYPYVVAGCWDYYRGTQTKRFHQEKAFNILSYHPDYINHIDGIEFDNINNNLDVVNQQQNLWCKVSKGYRITGRSFAPFVGINSRQIWGKCVGTEVEAI